MPYFSEADYYRHDNGNEMDEECQNNKKNLFTFPGLQHLNEVPQSYYKSTAYSNQKKIFTKKTKVIKNNQTFY